VSRRQAIDIALDALAKPEIASFLAAGPLPKGVKVLLRIVADGEWRDAATAHVYKTHSPEMVRSASAAFLAEVLFARQTDPYRALGLPSGASLQDVREHKRLLLKWLHPDRNPDAKEQGYLAKVIEAAEAIEGNRSHEFGSAARLRTSPPAAAPAKDGAAKKRSVASRVRRDGWDLSRLARQAVVTSLPAVRRVAKASALTLAILLSGLIIWRYVMDEPIGASLTRYAKLALGIVAWP
jgi:hypothetical protein